MSVEEHAPDYLGVIEEWRVWRIVDSGGALRLGSVVLPTVWKPGEATVAECLAPRRLGDWVRRRPRHGAPEAACDCGIYAASLEACAEYLRPAVLGERRVFGRVALWGTVVECEHGLRASHAYPQQLYVPAADDGFAGLSTNEIVHALAAYAVPVETVERQAAPAPRM